MYFMSYLHFNVGISMIIYLLFYFMSVFMSELNILSTEKLKLLTDFLNISTTIYIYFKRKNLKIFWINLDKVLTLSRMSDTL